MSFEGRLIAFYLPQFHPIPENDDWWGKGFTEWTNVARARPLFPGHHQPHLPADLGFYDLRLPEARQAQAELAREYGIHGFCYYHYWFNGHRLLGRPFDEVLASGQPTLPFCLCWANENWTRRWDGQHDEILIDQKYSDEDDREHIQWLLAAFRDPRYIRIDGRPLLLVYRASMIPAPLKMTTIWREEAQKSGLGDIYLCRVESFADERDDPTRIGFDAAVEFQPDWCDYDAPQRIGTHHLYEYRRVAESMARRPQPAYPRFPCVMPSWDNSPRRKRGATVFRGATPVLYEAWLRAAMRRADSADPGKRVVFINAWNEWAEGNHLEPCHKWGRGYLEATRSAIDQGSSPLGAAPAIRDARGEGSKYVPMIQTVQSHATEVLRQARAELIAAAAEVDAARAELTRLGRLRRATEELAAVLPVGSTFILVDEQQWGRDPLGGRHAVPFLERDGRYWGAPADDETGIRELNRLRRAGATFTVFAWPAFWWLEHYSALHRYLRMNFQCLLENERVVVFDLRSSGGG